MWFVVVRDIRGRNLQQRLLKNCQYLPSYERKTFSIIGGGPFRMQIYNGKRWMSFNANFCNGNRWIYYNAKFWNGMDYIRG